MRIAVFIFFISSGSGSPILSNALVNAFARSGLPQTSALFNAIVMAGASRCMKGEDNLRLNHELAMEPLSSIHLHYYPASGLSYGFCLYGVGSIISAASRSLKGEATQKLCSGLFAEPSPLIPWFFSWASGLRFDILLICFGPVIVAVHPCFSPTASVSPMPCRHHRMRSRRGHPRRAPSSPSSDSPSPSSDFSVGHYPRTRSGRGCLLASSHYPMPSPLSGSMLFTFNYSLNCPRITAHILVVFHEEA